MILPSRFPPDIRVEKEIRTLQAKHEICLLCLKRGNQPSTELLRGVRIRRVFTDWQRGWSHWRLLRTCRSGLWSQAIREFVREYRPDVLHVHDLPLLGPALEVARGSGVPVVADLHENYPAMLAARHALPFWRTASLGAWVFRLFARIDRWKAYEREAVAKADRVITVIDEARDRLVREGIEPARISVVGNYASLDAIDKSRDRQDGLFHALYAGNFGPTRDLGTVVSAIASLPRQEYPALRVQLVGGSGTELTRLRRMVEDLEVGDRVSVLPWLPLAEAERRMDDADVGLVPHVKSEHTDATIPHKLFQYMWRRLPVVVSDCAPLERIVNATGCGLSYRHGDAAALADCLRRLCRDRDLVTRMGEAGHLAVRDRYNWDEAGKELLRVYDNL
jgi:glycosyltransferase involved in cell wall biosynthesis